MAENKTIVDKLLSLNDDELKKSAELSDAELEEVFGGYGDVFYAPLRNGFLGMAEIMKKMEADQVTYEEWIALKFPEDKLKSLGYGPGDIVPVAVIKANK